MTRNYTTLTFANNNLSLVALFGHMNVYLFKLYVRVIFPLF